jgi:hypothetical protein
MKRAAFFVQGQTELIFVVELIKKLVGTACCSIAQEVYHSKVFAEISAENAQDEEFYFLIVNCSSDGAIVSAIRDRIERLEHVGYELVVGLRDLYPLADNELPMLVAGMRASLPQSAVRMEIVIAIREVEAWFIHADSHFSRLHEVLNSEAILNALGYDIHGGHAEEIDHPAKFLGDIYNLAGLGYRKTRKHVTRTVDLLDYHHLCRVRVSGAPSLLRLVKLVDWVIG